MLTHLSASLDDAPTTFSCVHQTIHATLLAPLVHDSPSPLWTSVGLHSVYSISRLGRDCWHRVRALGIISLRLTLMGGIW